jgi:cytochrome c oxidase cbb3-type subunit I/II
MPHDTWHRRVLENKAGLFAAVSTLAISVGGVVEILPMYTAEARTMATVTPYTPLEVAGRDIYIREGCYNCHSQMIRPMKAETLRYGEWSRAGEYVWDRPFQLGSRRIGPDLQRVGGKYPDAWHFDHMRDPRSTSPGSVMPAYTWLYDATVDPADVSASVHALATLGHPYDLATIEGDLAAQQKAVAQSIATGGQSVEPDREIVALIAYLQRLGRDGRAAIEASR